MRRKTKGNYMMMSGILFVFLAALLLLLNLLPERQMLIPFIFLLGLLLLFTGSITKKRDRH